MDLSAISERETIRLAQSGNEDAFAILYERNMDAVYRYIHKRVGEVYEAESITQTVFTKAWMALERYKPTVVPFRAWLYRIAHNAVVDYYRKQKDTVLWDDLASVSDSRSTPEEAILFQEVAQERSAQVHEAMAEIKPVYKDVLSYRFFNNMDYAETAEVLDRNVNSVRVLQHRALNSLQKALSHQAVAWVAAFAIFASMGFGAYAVRAAGDALPGDRLYALKIRIEDTLLALYDDAGDVQLYASYSEHRLAEIAALLNADGTGDDTVTESVGDIQTAAARLTSQLEGMSTALATVANDDPELARQLATQLEVSLAEQQETLNDYTSRESQSVESLLQSAVNAAAGVQSTINAIRPQTTDTQEPESSLLQNLDEGAGAGLDAGLDGEVNLPVVNEPPADSTDEAVVSDASSSDEPSDAAVNGADEVNVNDAINDTLEPDSIAEASNSEPANDIANANADRIVNNPDRANGDVDAAGANAANNVDSVAMPKDESPPQVALSDVNGQPSAASIDEPSTEVNNEPRQNQQSDNPTQRSDIQPDDAPKEEPNTKANADVAAPNGEDARRSQEREEKDNEPAVVNSAQLDESSNESRSEQRDEPSADRQDEPGNEPQGEGRDEPQDEPRSESKAESKGEPRDKANASSSNDKGGKSKKK